MTAIGTLTTRAAWKALDAHCLKVETGARRPLNHDSSTNTLIRRYRRSKELLHG